MTDREIAERIVSLPLWSELFKDEARALIHAIEAVLAARGIDGARQMRERAAAVIRPMDGADARDSEHYRWLAAQIAGLPLESTE